MTPSEPNDTCLIRSDMERFAAGKIADAESERVRRHLEACTACRMQVELLAGDSDVVFGKIRQAMPDDAAAVPPAARKKIRKNPGSRVHLACPAC